jgi:hypothetical protein
MIQWFKKLVQLSPVRDEASIGAPIPILTDKNNPFINGDDLQDEDVRAQHDFNEHAKHGGWMGITMRFRRHKKNGPFGPVRIQFTYGEDGTPSCC